MILLCGLNSIAQADTLRIATFNTELSRKGPGLLLRDILKGDDPKVNAVARVIAQIAPDILLLQDIDHDPSLAALSALRDVIARHGLTYPHLFAPEPNSGRDSGADLDGDGRLGEPEDAHGYGWFSGDGGMALLSRFPIRAEAAVDYSDVLWADMPDPLWPTPILPDQIRQRLSHSGHWRVPVSLGKTELIIMGFHASSPVFDGPEDRNGRRNHDEIRFWLHVLDGIFGPPPAKPFVLLGDANLDPKDGEGRHRAIRALLSDPRIQDPEPRRPGAPAQQEGQSGDPALDTVLWPSPEPGALRVSYVLPSASLNIAGAGVHWPEGGPEAALVDTASRHRIVWVDLTYPTAP